tara:strand:- start:559 stop:1164 length:606 start_codon:yes stop_codon:yes gene_type:complete
MLTLPYAIKFKEDMFSSTGLIDSNIQMEKVIFSNIGIQHQLEISLVGRTTVPTGSIKKVPATGLGTPSAFGGVTLSYIGQAWYGFADGGYQYNFANKSIQPGHRTFYDAGIGRHLIDIANLGYLFFLIEVNGQHTLQSTSIEGLEPDSGGHILLLTPSLTFASNSFYAQLGGAIPVHQKLNSLQNKEKFLGVLLMGFTIDT